MGRQFTPLAAVTMAAGLTAGLAGCGMLSEDDSRPPAEVLDKQIAAAVEAAGTDQVAGRTIGRDRRSGWITLWNGSDLVEYDLPESSEVLSSPRPRGSVPAADLDLATLATFADDVSCTESEEAALIESVITVPGSIYVAAYCDEGADPAKQALEGELVPDLDDFLTADALETVLREIHLTVGDGLTELSIYPEFGEVAVRSAPVLSGEGEVQLSRFLSGEGEMTGLDLPGSSYRDLSGDPVFRPADVPAHHLLAVIETGLWEAGADPDHVPFQVSVGPDEDAANVIVSVTVTKGDEPVQFSLDGTVLS